MHLIVIAWCEFWLAVLTPLPERRSARIYQLDDYRPKPTTPNDRRAA
jgi:hypothetical protein